MIQNVVSSDGIHFLTPEDLVDAIEDIEAKFPGWWWSISQKKILITLSLGPGQNCPNPKDIAFMKTRVGDAGLSYLFHYENGSKTLEFLSELPGVFELITQTRDNTPPEDLELRATSLPLRKQGSEALKELKIEYETFLKELPTFESKGRVLQELYLGSCDYSVDCSLRGNRAIGEDFDVSVDLIGTEHCIAHSLHWAMDELNEDILTYATGPLPDNEPDP